MKTDYYSRIYKTEKEKEVLYRFDILNKRRGTVFSTNFRCLEGDENFRVLEETNHDRYFHGIVPKDRLDEFLERLTRNYSVSYFTKVLEGRNAN